MGTKKNVESSSKEKKRESRERAKVRAEAAIAKAETTNESQFKELLDMLEGMPPERGLTPWYDVSDASVAAYRLYEDGNAVRDKFERLLAVKPGLLDTLDLLVKVAGALSYIRMQLLEAQGTEDDVTVPKDLLARAEDVRNRMIEVLEYVLGKDPIIAAALAFIRQGTGHQDRIQDLALLIKYYRDRAKDLEKDVIRYDAEDARRAAEYADAIEGHLRRAKVKPSARWSDLQSRANALLADTYEKVRATLVFLEDAPGGEAKYPPLTTAARAISGPAPSRRPTPIDAEPQTPAPNGPDSDTGDDT